MVKVVKKVKVTIITLILLLVSTINSFATDIDAPSLTEVRAVSDQGLDLVFGGAGGICVVIAIFQLVQGFLSLSSSRRSGGSGQAKSDMIWHFIAGGAAFIAAILCFWGLATTKDLFHI